MSAKAARAGEEAAPKVGLTAHEESPGRRVLRRFLAQPIGVAAAGFLVVLTVIAIVFYVLHVTGVPFPSDPNATNLEARLLPPGPGHWLGTDNLGRDVLSRVLHGSYVSLTIGLVAVAVSITIGIVVGAIAGYVGGWLDNLLMRIVDAIMCFPSFFLILTVIALLGPGIMKIVIVIGLVAWTGTSRLVRAEFLTLRESEYVKAAQALGQSHVKVIFRHILPNAMAPVFVAAVLGVPDAILTEAGLSFLGIGVQPPQPTWGNIIADGKTYILDAWWLIVFPGLAILLTTLSFYLAGEALREALQTRTERK